MRYLEIEEKREIREYSIETLSLGNTPVFIIEGGDLDSPDALFRAVNSLSCTLALPRDGGRRVVGCFHPPDFDNLTRLIVENNWCMSVGVGGATQIHIVRKRGEYFFANFGSPNVVLAYRGLKSSENGTAGIFTSPYLDRDRELDDFIIEGDKGTKLREVPPDEVLDSCELFDNYLFSFKEELARQLLPLERTQEICYLIKIDVNDSSVRMHEIGEPFYSLGLTKRSTELVEKMLEEGFLIGDIIGESLRVFPRNLGELIKVQKFLRETGRDILTSGGDSFKTVGEIGSRNVWINTQGIVDFFYPFPDFTNEAELESTHKKRNLPTHRVVFKVR